MKIAVFHNLPSGGAKRALFGNVTFLSKKHEVDVFVPSTANENYLPLKDIVNNLRIFPVKNNIPSFLYSTMKYFPSKISLSELKITQKRIANEINRGEYDVVLSEQDRFTMSPFILKYIEKPLVYYCQQPNYFRYEISKNLYKDANLQYKNVINGLYLELFGSKIIKHDKKYAGYSNYMLANSKFSKEKILNIYGIDAKVSYLGVDNDLFKPIDTLKENFVLSVGQCIPEKGFEFILKSLAKIDVNIRPSFVLVTDQGNIHWKNYLEKLASKLDVNLRILQLITDQDLVMLYNKAKLIVYAPYDEPFGLVPLESLSCGTPVVGVNEGGVKETVIDGKTGILTERDENVFAEEVVKLLSNEQKINKLGKQSVKIINNNWTLNKSGQRLLNHLRSTLE
jgi:glycosyltransferase involved in cell wall biosynthesis